MKKKIFDIIVCPSCKGQLDILPEEKKLHCPVGKKTYYVHDNIIIMI